MHALELDRQNDYLFGRREATIAFVLTLALMVFDYATRQIIVSVFPYLKANWGLSDTQLGALVSVVSVTVAIAGIPIALVADRWSRVKSIAVMALVWSAATMACMAARGYGQLLGARALVGLGEAGYGSVGAGLIASHFPSRMRGALMAGFFASASVGSVLGVMLGGIIAANWGWKAAFGVVGIPGLILALLYLLVRDYQTVGVNIGPAETPAPTQYEMIRTILFSRTVRWICTGAAAQLIAVSALWSWLPSFLNRAYGMTPDKAGVQAALVVLAGALGSVVLGAVVDWAGTRRADGRFLAVALLSTLSMLALVIAFGAAQVGIEISQTAQFRLILLGSFLAPCTVGPAAAIIIDVVHPGVRSTGASVLTLVQNLLGLALGPFLAGLLSDAMGLTTALTLTPLACVIAVVSFLIARTAYQIERISEPPKQAAMVPCQEAFA